ncbi:unnamed protein product [Moneuplotes crassus]|uniref:EF-hand domain-containing protein n=1 Tax=Euplotes crassus TaxID=5936 RepID=A0AAD1XBB8_EUPCR|nr:unnamed protein product [Moneuplotes crassus]
MSQPKQKSKKRFDPDNEYSGKEAQCDYIIQKYTKKGFESLSLEELAFTMVTNNFGLRFKEKTGNEWSTPIQMKVIERLRRCNFDIQWMTRTGKLPVTDTEFCNDVYFGLIRKGDVDKIIEYMRKYKEDILDAVDSKKRTGLHAASEHGQNTVVDLMINAGLNINARDKLLRTPLHWASIGAHDGCADLLLKAGCDQFQKDCLGRTAFHYAATGGDASLLILMAAKEPEIVHCTDDHGRSALHYAIFNKNPRQVNIIRTLLELKSDVNALDEERKTPLHHAAESAKMRIIPILVQNGASLVIRDKTNKKTPVQAAANEKIRELILMYCEEEIPKEKKKEKVETLKASRGDLFDEFKPGVKGTKTDYLKKHSPQSSKKKGKVTPWEEKKKRDELEELESKGLLPFDLRNHRTKLIKLMKKVQEYGVNHNLHKKKRYIFSGSWMEKVEDITELMASIHETNSSETALKIFNVIHPYDKPLPPIDEEEDALREFYEGDQKKLDYNKSLLKQTPEAFRERMAAKGMDNLMMSKKDQTSSGNNEETKDYMGEPVDSEEFRDLQNLLKATEDKLESANKEIDSLKLTIDEREEIIEQLREQLNQDTAVAEDVQLENKKQADVIIKLNNELKDAHDQIEEVKKKLVENKKEYEKLVKDIPEVKELEAIRKSMQNNERQRVLDGQRDKALRFRSGMLFQRALDKLDKDEQKPKPTKTKKKDPVKSGDYYLTDDKALIRFLNSVERNDKSLYQRLLDADIEKTGTLRKSQFTEMLNDLKVTPQDVMSLQRIAGFTSGRNEIQIDEFIKIIKERGKIRQTVEEDTFRKIQKSIRKQGWTIHETFQMFDIDRNNKIDFQEMVNGFKKLKIHIPNKHLKSIFAILDEDSNGTISLPEFRKKLDQYDTKSRRLDNLDGSVEKPGSADDQNQEDAEEEEYKRQEELKRKKAEEDKQKSLLTDKDIKEYKSNIDKTKQLVKSDVQKKRQLDEIEKQVKEEKKQEHSRRLLKGQLKVQVGKGYKLANLQAQGYKYFYIVFYLEGTNENQSFTSKPILYYAKNSFHWSALIPLVDTHPDDLGDEFHVKFYASKGEFENSEFYGEVFCKWKSTLQKHNEYVIANKFEISDNKNQCNIAKVQGRVMVSAKYIPAGDEGSLLTVTGKAKESLKEAQEKGTKKVQKGPVTKIGNLQVEIFRGKEFEPKPRHKLILRLDGSKNKENTQTVKPSDRPDFDEKVIIPIYKRETEDVPNLIIQDIDPDEEDILSSLSINFSKIAYTKKQAVINTKWYAFDDKPEKVLQMQLSFTNAHYKPPKEKSKSEAEILIDEDKAPAPKMTEFKFDDSSIPDPKDTNKFADEFPSESSDNKLDPIAEEDDQAPEKPLQFNIGDTMGDVSEGSGDFNNL